MINKNKAVAVVLALSFLLIVSNNINVVFAGLTTSTGADSKSESISTPIISTEPTVSDSKPSVEDPVEPSTGGVVTTKVTTETADLIRPRGTFVPAGYVTPGTFNSFAGPTGDYKFPGNVFLASTTNSSSGVIYKGTSPFIHDFALPGTFGRNTFVGVNSGNFTMTGSSLSNGSYNTAIGYATLNANTTGNSNTAAGYNSLASNTNGDSNTASGYNSLFTNTNGDFNVANGFKALYLNTTGNHNTANGAAALYSNTTGYFNTATGDESLFYNTTGYSNTAAGHYSLYTNNNGTLNVANGNESLFFNTGGSRNVAAGSFSLHNNTSGNDNVAVGEESLYQNTTANLNTAIGTYSLFSNTTGSYNTAVGPYSGYNSGTFLNTMSSTTFIGSGANSSANAISNSTAIGAGAQVTRSNQVVIGNPSVTQTVLRGNVSIGGRICVWNGANYTLVSFAPSSIVPIYSTSTSC